jgi:hypothetical protein
MHERSHVPILPILGVCAAILLVGLIATAAYRVSNPQSLRTVKPVKSSPLSTESLINELGTKLPVAYGFLHPQTPQAQTNAGYQFPGDSFQVELPPASPSLAYSDSTTADESSSYNDFGRVAVYIRTFLESKGFQAAPSEDQTSGLLSAVYFYTRSDAVCQVSVYTNLSITCSPVSQLEAMAAQSRPLYAVYSGVAPDSGTTVLAAPSIRVSQTAGYTIATLPIYNNHGETSANFYKQAASSWQIVNLSWYNDPHEDGDILPNCGDFESYTPTQKAFAGQTCYDSGARITRTITE